jgi:hypothetical protein
LWEVSQEKPARLKSPQSLAAQPLLAVIGMMELACGIACRFPAQIPHDLLLMARPRPKVPVPHCRTSR